MFVVVITEKGGEQRRMDFDKSEVTIGRVQGNDIILPKGNVSKRHSRIVLKDGKFIIVDLKSTNGTYVNGRKITSPLVVKPSDKIYIGDFILAVEDGETASQPSVSTPAAPAAAAVRKPPSIPPRRPPVSAEDSLDDLGADSVPPPPIVPPAPPLVARTAAPAVHDDDEDDDDILVPPTIGPLAVPAPPVKPPSEPPRIPSGAVPPPRPMAPPRMPQAAREVSEREPSGPLPTGAPPRRPGPVAVPAPPPTAASTSPSAMRPAVPEPIRKPTSQREGARAQSEGSLAAPVPRGGRPIDIQRAVFDRLSEMMDLRRVELSRLGDEEFWEKAENTICDIVETMEAAGSIPKSIDQDALIKDVLNEALGLGPLEDMLADSEVTQILVVRADQIYVERGGRIVASERSFSSERALLRVIERMLSRRPDDRGAPIGEGRLADGSRFVAMLPPVAVRGPCVGIRKPHREAATLDGLVGREVLSKSMAEFLELALRARRNIVVSGGVGAGQPQLLGALGRALPPDERVVSIEDVSTLDLSREHWVALEAHPPQVGVRELLHGALRLRPDRLVVGDVRGAEALELVQAMATGSDGTLVGMHGSSPRETLSRLETLMEVGGHSLPTQVARSLITQAVSLVVQMVRLPDGARRVSHIAELTGLADGGFELNDVFAWKADGTGPDGVRGRFLASGFVPKFCEDLSRRGVQINQAIFKE